MRRLLDLVAAGAELFNFDSLVFASRNGTGLKRKVVRAALKRAVKAPNSRHPSGPCTISATATPAC
jgi:hypothetical protein